MTRASTITGPVLFLDHAAEGRLALAALFVAPPGVAIPPIEAGGRSHEAVQINDYGERLAWRIRFQVPADAPSSYRWDGEDYALAGDMGGDLRIAYVSCNGEEIGDLDREGSERNAMWARLGASHREAPFALLLHGGDQVYADEATKGHRLGDGWPTKVPEPESDAELEDFRRHLRDCFSARYDALYAAPEFAWLAARVPSLMQWDDHDICDGWGSLHINGTGSPVAKVLFEAAREAFLTFQHAASDGDLPARIRPSDGPALNWSVDLPGLRLLAPDLRAERTPHHVMQDEGWGFMEDAAAAPAPARTLILSSVPLLGPRLSLLERMMGLIPKIQKYEDDLRDQWQSRAHRAQWRRMLGLVRDILSKEGAEVTAVSGEIHLATRAHMSFGVERELHQLVASGIAHRPPPNLWARTLGALATLGEDPLPDSPITIERIPGQKTRYVAQRNFLTLAREDGAWSARWCFEESGMSPPLQI
ncbi:alkaline phosphatase D family protein [Rhodovulum sp. DZ06]|uniref:alkaline phosphatase D family protein n=1 Tax=Rhodovulum sp. DZ06 TaxID=3425126 RepID=UPI003D32893A